MLNLERDLQIAEAMASDLKIYLLSDTLYWPITSRGLIRQRLIRGTIGAMLLRLHHLDVLRDSLTTEQLNRLVAAQHAARTELDRWVVQAEWRAAREIRARLRQWSTFVDEVEEAPLTYQSEYPVQAYSRTAIRFLIDVAGRSIDGSGLISRLLASDRKLAKMVEEAAFVLDSRLQAAYPQKPFWWLYCIPVEPEDVL